MAVPSAARGLPADVSAAIARSNLRRLAPNIAAEVIRGGRRVRVVAGETVRGAGTEGSHAELLLAGFVRISLESPDGRRMTVRYCRPGAMTGIASLFTPGFVMPGSIQALVDSELLVLDPVRLRRAAERDPAVAVALLDELSQRTLSFVAEIPGSVFTTVRQRVARHLLDLASERQEGARLTARVSQQALADAVGSVREVIVRVLRELRQEGLVRTGRAGIEILTPERLLAESIDPLWDQGS